MNVFKKTLFFLLFIIFATPSYSIKKTSKEKWNGHPYLFFSESNIPEIKKRLTKEPFLTRWEIFIQNADAVVKTSPHYYNPENGKVGRSRKHLENAGKTSFAYVITKDKKYSKRAIAEAMAIVEGVIPEKNDELVWYNPKHRDWNKGADLNTAELCYGLAMVYDWCYDAMTPEERNKIKEALLVKGIKHYVNSIERDRQDFWVDNPVSNWAGVVNGGMGLAALAIYHESEMAQKAVRYAQKYIPQFLDHVFLEDGGGHEGIMYARYGELFAFYFMMSNQRLFGLDVKFLEKFNQKLAGYWDVYLQAPDMQYANFNNMGEETFHGLWGNDHRSAGGPNSDINALMEIFTPNGDPLLLWAADNGAPRFYWTGASPWYFLWRRENADAVPAADKPELQDAVLFRGAGHAVFQSDKLWLIYNAGWTSNRSHNNKDLGSFILVTNKERLVHDPGYGDTHVMNHSSIMINNKDQLGGRAGKFLKFGTGETYHYLVSDLTDAYEDKELKSFRRHMLMVDDGEYIVIMDELKAENSTEIEWRLQTRKEAEIFQTGNAIINGETNKMLVINAGDKMNTKIINWEGKNGKINAISKTPKKQKETHVFVTILFPFQDNEYEINNYPSVTFNKGILSISRKDKKDIIKFKNGTFGWVLESINNKDVNLLDAAERNIQPFRENKNTSIDISKLPQWFLPIE